MQTIKFQLQRSEMLDNEDIVNEVTVESVVEKYAKETLDKEKEQSNEIVIFYFSFYYYQKKKKKKNKLKMDLKQ